MDCPKCGKTLGVKTGQYGDFLACPGFPLCRYTHAMWSLTDEERETLCPKCNGKKFVPFIKNGHIIPNAFIDCECKKDSDKPGIFHPRNFDFPMSYAFYRSLSKEHGWTEPVDCFDTKIEHQKEIERWGEYIVNGNPPSYFQTKLEWQEAKQAYGRRVRQDVVEIDRKVEGLNKALANHLTPKPTKAPQTLTPIIRTIGI